MSKRLGAVEGGGHLQVPSEIMPIASWQLPHLFSAEGGTLITLRRTCGPRYQNTCVGSCLCVCVRMCACKCVSVCTCPCYRFIVKSGKKPFESLQKRVRRRAAAYRVRRYVIYQSVPVVGIAVTAVYCFRRFFSTQGSTTPQTREPTHTSPTWKRV